MAFVVTEERRKFLLLIGNAFVVGFMVNQGQRIGPDRRPQRLSARQFNSCLSRIEDDEDRKWGALSPNLTLHLRLEVKIFFSN